MRSLLRLLLLSLLFVPQAGAQEEFLEAVEFQSMQKVRIRLIPEKECVEKLEDFLFPKAMIVKGLESLEVVARQIPFPREEQLSCLSFAVEQGTAKMAEVQLPNLWGGWGGFGMYGMLGGQNQYDPEKMAKMQSLFTKLQCFNKADPGTKAFDQFQKQMESHCSGKWLTKDEYEAMQKEYNALQEELTAWSQKMMEKSSLLSSIPAVLDLYTPAPDLSSWTILQQKLLCYKGEEIKSNPFFNYQADLSHCGEKSLTKEEFEAGLKEFEKENAKLTEWQQKSSLEFQKWSEFLSGHVEEAKIDVFQLKEPISNLLCHKSQTMMGQGFGMPYSGSNPCQGKMIDQAQMEASKSKISAALPDLKAKFQEWTKHYEKKKAEKEAEIRKLVEKKYSQYGDTRLLARFHGYLKAGGKPEKLESFCRDYERLQKRDKKFAEAELGFQVFTTPQDWEYARNYGITEGELSAIRAYTGSFFSTINPALWSGKELDEKLKLYKETMDDGMSRLPPYKETALIRFATLPDKVLDQHQVGNIVTYQAYTSTSKKQDWKWAGNHRFVIFAAKKGKKVSDVSYFPGEEEILFQAGTKFKVLSRKENPEKPGFIEFVLAEVDEQGNVIASVPEL